MQGNYDPKVGIIVGGRSQLKLKEAAEAKIHAFMTLLGEDARILTEGEPIGSHELFSKLVSKKTITGEDEEEAVSELQYLQAIKEIRDKQPDLFERVKRLPKKARTGRKVDEKQKALLTYFRKGKLQKFFIASSADESEELDFIAAASILEVDSKAKRNEVGDNYYELLQSNKNAFAESTAEEQPEPKKRGGGKDTGTMILQILKAIKDLRKLTDDQEDYLQRVMRQLEEGGLTKQTTKRTHQALQAVLKEHGQNPVKILGTLRSNIPPELLEVHVAESAARTAGPREVILSEYLEGV